MKIAYMSDLHLEMSDIKIKNTEKADVLMIVGRDLINREFR